MTAARPIRAPDRRPTWAERVAARAEAHPLIDSRLSREGLRGAGDAAPPGAVYVGVGLCAKRALSRGVPLDLLGLLLPAAAVREASGADVLVVLIADRHALESGFPEAEVEERAAAAEQAVARVGGQCGLRGLKIVRASHLESEPAYADALAAVRARAGPACGAYTARQLADAIYLEGCFGGLLKVGWALRGANEDDRRDEVAFDRALRRMVGERIPFVYSKPGRSLDDRAPRVPPYVATEPETRLCLDRPSDPAHALARAARAASRDTVAGYRRHLRALIYAYSREVERLPRGPLEVRAAALLERLSPRRGAAAAAGGPAAAAGGGRRLVLTGEASSL